MTKTRNQTQQAVKDILDYLENNKNSSGLETQFKTRKGSSLFDLVTKELGNYGLTNLECDDFYNIMKENELHMASTTEQLIFWFK